VSSPARLRRRRLSTPKKAPGPYWRHYGDLPAAGNAVLLLAATCVDPMQTLRYE